MYWDLSKNGKAVCINVLMYWDLNKMVAILQTNFTGEFSWKNLNILIEISLKFVLMDTITNKSALVHVVVLYQICDKPLPEPVMTQFIDIKPHSVRSC